MPSIEIPLRDVSEVRGLRKNQKFLNEISELIKVTDQIKRLNERAGELRLSTYDVLDTTLNEGEKSVVYKGHRLTKIQAAARSTLDKEKLLMYIPASKLEKCYSVGEPPRPTVQVSRIKDGDEEEEETVTSRVTKKLRKGLPG